MNNLIHLFAEDWRDFNERRENLDKDIKNLQSRKKQSQEIFNDRYNLEKINNSIESYLVNRGFERVNKLPWSKDIFRNFTRRLKKNPLFISEKGYGFRINNSSSKRPYDFIKLRKKDNVNNLLRHFDMSKDVNKNFFMVGSAIFLGTLGGMYNIGQELNSSSIINSLFLGGGGCMVYALGAVGKIMISPKKSISINSGKYDVISELFETSEPKG